MRCTLLFVLGFATLLLGCASRDGVPVAPRPGPARQATELGPSFEPLRSAFNASSDRWRAVLLVSPVCSECILGAEAVEKEITRRYPGSRVKTLVVWSPNLRGDSPTTARQASAIFPQAAVEQFYDGGQRLGTAYSKGPFAGFARRAERSLPEGSPLHGMFEGERSDRPQWDLYMLYPPGVTWEGGVPAPSHWVRHVGRLDGTTSNYWRDSPDAPPRRGSLFEAIRAMAAEAMPTLPALRVELLGFPGCPNSPVMRDRLRAALASLSMDARVTELNLEALPDGDPRRGYGSPTVLVNGRDLFGMPVPTSTSIGCRTYDDGVPSADQLASRLRETVAGLGGI
ncbi:MAG: hypothetical protein WD749_02215 [Phycisphaerales bacterium]